MAVTIIGVPAPVEEILAARGMGDLAHGILTYDELSITNFRALDERKPGEPRPVYAKGLRLDKIGLAKINQRLKPFGAVIRRRVSRSAPDSPSCYVFYSLVFFCTAGKVTP